MYVCVCKAVTDKQIKAAIGNGICTRRQLHDCLGVGKDCGKCNPHIKNLLNDNRQLLSVMPQAANNQLYFNAALQ